MIASAQSVIRRTLLNDLRSFFCVVPLWFGYAISDLEIMEYRTLICKERQHVRLLRAKGQIVFCQGVAEVKQPCYAPYKTRVSE